MINFYNVTVKIISERDDFTSVSSYCFKIAANSIEHANSRLSRLVRDYDVVEIVKSTGESCEFPLVLVSKTGNLKGKVNHKHSHV